MAMDLYVALVHYPVYDKNRKVVTTAITNVDVHDIARAGATYGVVNYFLVTPVQAQQVLASELLTHWTDGAGARYNPRRKVALDRVRVVSDIAECCRTIKHRSGSTPVTIATGAAMKERNISHEAMRHLLQERQGSALLILGTGWGLERSFLESVDFRLAPVLGRGEYNHLSVRSAAAILLDRLAGAARNQL
jgi:hypothetical protein